MLSDRLTRGLNLVAEVHSACSGDGVLLRVELSVRSQAAGKKRQVFYLNAAHKYNCPITEHDA